jgi:tetratricopeptide (TPR) repeat protein
MDKQDDFDIFDAIVNSKNLLLKFIFEFGSLKTSQRNFLAGTSSALRIKIDPFREGIARNYYSYVHGAPAPSDLMYRTRGLPLLIEQKKPLDYCDEALSTAAASIESLSIEENRILALVYVCGGSVQISFARRIIGTNKVEKTIEALVFKRVLVTRDGFAQFRHHAFYLYFDSMADDDVITRIRETICNLPGELQTKPMHEIIITGSNTIALGRQDLIDGLLEKVLVVCFERSAFAAVVRLYEAVLGRGLDIKPGNARRQIAQSYVLLGDGGSAYELLHSQRYLTGKVALPDMLILAQAQYEANLFDASNETLKSIILDCEEKHAVIAYGQLASNAIALGNFGAAKENYTVARDIARSINDLFLEYEVIRLSPKIHDKSIAILELRGIEDSLLPKRFPLTFAKCMHNRGVARLLQFRDLDGLKDIIVAKNIFEANQAHILTYSLMMQGLIAAIEHKYAEAEAIMLDALNLAINRYERFSLLSNLGSVSAFKGDFATAESRYAEAKSALRSGARPLLDPDLTADADFNLALINAVGGRFEAAREILDELLLPSTVSFYDAVEERTEWLRDMIADKQPIVELRTAACDGPNWLIREFRCSLATLSFYDFSINVSAASQ